ncbi:UNVERIFIED_CONTAM: hypothetical protein Slati_3020700 [Sesamum latifolium]|uniref:Myb/SANT-like domain-containing protein n=1 Tax=Sesamum latifolium TaxID=2727402 RepID=A0AAW2VHP8_9LAMI
MSKSGLGWDDCRNMVTVEDDNAWDEFIKSDPSAKGMRYKSWPFFPAWRKIFGKDRATGERGWDPTRAENERTGRDGVDFEQSNAPTGNWNPETGFEGINEEPPQSNNNNCDPTVNSSSATKRTSNRRKRKTTEACPEIPQLALESEFGDPSKRVVVMEAVREIQGLEENDVLVVTTKLVHDPQSMKIFFSLSQESKAKMARLILDGRI